MTATQVQLRRDTATNLNAATPASGEAGWNTTDKRLHGGDGSRMGGWPIPNFSDIQKSAFTACTVGGSANAITLTSILSIIAYAQHVTHRFKATSTNTSTVTVDVDGKGAKNIYKMVDGSLTGLEAGDINSGGMYEITYDGTQYQIRGLDESRGEASGLTLLSIASGGGATYDFTSGIDTTYQHYLFVLDSVFPADQTDLLLRVRRSGQGSFDAGGSDYGWLTDFPDDDNTDSSINLAPLVENTGAAGIGVSGVVWAHNLAQAAYSQINWEINNFITSGVVRLSRGGGMRKSTSALDGVRFLFSSGNISSGNIYLYGMDSAL